MELKPVGASHPHMEPLATIFLVKCGQSLLGRRCSVELYYARKPFERLKPRSFAKRKVSLVRL